MVIKKRDDVTLDFMDLNIQDDNDEEKENKNKNKEKVKKFIIQRLNKRIDALIYEALNIFID